MSLIQSENLTKIYNSGSTAVTALDRVSVTIERGEFVAIMGPSGCGKSTLLHLLGGLDRATSGSVTLDGHNLNQLDDDHLTVLRRRKIGFIFQFYNLIPVLTAVENAALPVTLDGMQASLARSRAVEWLEGFGLGECLNRRPDELSGGQQQRVAIARAMVSEPALILADEPTGNLDTLASGEIASLLRLVSKPGSDHSSSDAGRAVVMVTHDPRIAAYADRIIFLKDGRIADETVLEKRK